MDRIVSLHLEIYNLLTLIIIQVQYYMNVIYNLRDEHRHTTFMGKSRNQVAIHSKTNVGLVLKHIPWYRV